LTRKNLSCLNPVSQNPKYKTTFQNRESRSFFNDGSHSIDESGPIMKAVWYESQGPARTVFHVGTMPDPVPVSGEVRIRLVASGINPGDVKKRSNAFGIGLPYPRIIPHSDGSGLIDQLGPNVPAEWLGRRVWCYGAQSYRPFGTAAECTVLPLRQVVPLADSVSFEAGACLGIPAITAYMAVHAGTVSVDNATLEGKTVLVQGGAGAVGSWAIRLAKQSQARVLAVVRQADDVAMAEQAGADAVLVSGDVSESEQLSQLRALAPDGVHYIVDVAFAANIGFNAQALAMGGSIAAYATDHANPTIPFWPLAFSNARLFFIGSDDFTPEEKIQAAQGINEALTSGWHGLPIAATFPLEEIAAAHELLESGKINNHKLAGRVVLTI
jgi:NADPH:quinone reductase